MLLYITTPGRCGSSLIALFCEKMGYVVDPQYYWSDDFDCGLEAKDVKVANRLLLVGTDSAMSQSLLTKRAHNIISSFDRKVIKDVDLFHHPKVFHAWKEHHPDMRVILCWREMNAQYDSWVRKRSIEAKVGSINLLGQRVYPKSCNLEITRKEFLDRYRAHEFGFIKTARKTNTPFKVLKFPHFVADYPSVYAALSWGGLEIDYKEGEEIWSEIAREDKVHFPVEMQQAT